MCLIVEVFPFMNRRLTVCLHANDHSPSSLETDHPIHSSTAGK